VRPPEYATTSRLPAPRSGGRMSTRNADQNSHHHDNAAPQIKTVGQKGRAWRSSPEPRTQTANTEYARTREPESGRPNPTPQTRVHDQDASRIRLHYPAHRSTFISPFIGRGLTGFDFGPIPKSAEFPKRPKSRYARFPKCRNIPIPKHPKSGPNTAEVSRHAGSLGPRSAIPMSPAKFSAQSPHAE
jgi:hypothetical protein